MTKAQSLFEQYRKECGMDDDDVKAARWYKDGLIDFADWLLQQKCEQCNVMRSLPPLPDIELALNMAQAELRYCYRTLGYKKSNVISKVDDVLEAVQAAMPS